MTYKTVQFTPKGELAERLWLHCSEEACNGVRYLLFNGNPQDVVREALYFYEAITKQQPKGSGDRSQWQPGEAVKVSLWAENADALTKNATASGVTKQELIQVALTAYLNQIDKTLK
jgi:hypothetical protein